MTRFLILLLVLGAARWSATAATLTLTSQELYLFIGADDPFMYSPASAEYFTNLDGDNFGTYGWTITNNTGSAWSPVSLFFFYDGSWDEGVDIESNNAFDEYGELWGLGLSPGAPAGAIAPDGYEIDEPGYVFGDIYTNVSFLGTVDNFNAVPSSAPEDVSLAYRWVLPSLAAGDTLRLTIQHLSAATEGISHVDPDDSAVVFVNGYLEVEAAEVTGVPEPGTIWAMGAGLLALGYAVRKRGK
jgi:hypothetical protein